MDYKVVIVGDDGLAKRWLAIQMTQNSSWTEESLVQLCPYKRGYILENEITDDAFSKQVAVASETHSVQYTVKIIDTTGMDLYPGIYEKHLRTADAFCLLFSPNNPQSWANIDIYLEEIRLIRKSHRFAAIFVSHTMTDNDKHNGPDEANHQMDHLMKSKINHLVRRFAFPLVETSPEDEFCVEKAFQTLMKEVRKFSSENSPFPKKSPWKRRCIIS